jgi:6-phosphogluconolactonase
MNIAPARWHRFADAEALAANVAQRILEVARDAIQQRGLFRLVLAGGVTPRAVYARLADADADWERWEIYFGDERCLKPQDPDRNSRMAAEVLLNRVAIPTDKIHQIPVEHGPKAAAEVYQGIIEKALPFDMVLLGLGEDGHTASLFPGQAHEGNLVVPVRSAPKPPAERVSLTAAAFGNARQVYFIVSGVNKRKAVRAWRRGDRLPAATVTSAGGVDVFVDAAAWPLASND